MREGTFCKMGSEGIQSAHVKVHPSHFRTLTWTSAHSEVEIGLKSAKKETKKYGVTQNKRNNDVKGSA